MGRYMPTAAELLDGDCSEDEFRTAVDADLRRKAPDDVAAALRSPQVRRRWLMVMVAMQRKAEGTLSARREEWMAYVADYDSKLTELEVNRQRARGEARRKINDQITRLKAERQRRESDYRNTRAGSLRFKTGLEEWLIEARALCAELDTVAPSAQEVHASLRRLFEAWAVQDPSGDADACVEVLIEDGALAEEATV